MKQLAHTRHRLNRFPYQDPVRRRLAGLLQPIFIGLIVICILGILLLTLTYGLQILSPATVLPNTSVALVMGLGLVLLRRGALNASVWVLIITLIIGQSLSYLYAGFVDAGEAKMLSLVTLTLASLVLNRRALIITLVLTLLTGGLIAVAQLPTYPTSIASLIAFVILLSIISLVLDLFGEVFRRALVAAFEREKQLEREVETRRASEQSLAEQREQYRVTLASIGDAVIATDTQGRVTFINPAAESLTGWDSATAIGQTLSRVYPIVHEGTHTPAASPIERVLKEGVVVGLENHTVLVARNQSLIPISHSGAPIRGTQGDVMGAILVFRDVTEERRSEAELKESESRFRTLSDSAPVFIWMSGEDSLCTFVNKQWLDFTGTTFEQAVGRGWLDSVHPDDRELCLTSFLSAFEQHQSFSIVYRLRRWDGVYAWVLAHSTPRILSEGTFAGYIGSCMNISDRIEAEERTQLLQALTSELSSTLTTHEVADVFIEVGFSLLNVPMGIIALVDEHGDLEVIGQHLTARSLGPSAFDLTTAVTPLLEDIAQQQHPLWIEDIDTMPEWVSCFGPYPIRSSAAVPLMVDQRSVGVIMLGFTDRQTFDTKQQAFLRAFAQQCAQALERAHLHRQAQRTAALAERQRLARELHDAVSQTLFSATSLAEGLPSLLERDPARGRSALHDMVTLNRAAMAEMRTLLLELRPESILRTPLANLLEQLVNAAKGRKGIEGTLAIIGEEAGLNDNIHLALYRIAQESINNILKHSQATELSLRLVFQSDSIHLEITDNGLGFDIQQPNRGMGLNNIRERAAFSNGSVEIASQPGNGTRIVADWKLANEDEVSIAS